MRESLMWLRGVNPLRQSKKFIDVCDQVADTFEFIEHEVTSGRRFVIRAAYDRGIVIGHGGTSSGQSGYNVPQSNIRRLDDESGQSGDDLSPTKVKTEIQNVISQADEDDLVVVWVGAHGWCSTNDLRSGQESAPYTLLKGGKMTASDYDAAFAGVNSQVLFVLDTCHSRAITAEVTNPNVIAISSTDWTQTAGDGFFTPAILQAMAYNPDGDFLNEVREVTDDVFNQKLEAFTRSSSRKALAQQGLLEDVRTSYASVKGNGFEVGALLTPDEKKLFRAYSAGQRPMINDNGASQLHVNRTSNYQPGRVLRQVGPGKLFDGASRASTQVEARPTPRRSIPLEPAGRR
jgi:hypothetical protein